MKATSNEEEDEEDKFYKVIIGYLNQTKNVQLIIEDYIEIIVKVVGKYEVDK